MHLFFLFACARQSSLTEQVWLVRVRITCTRSLPDAGEKRLTFVRGDTWQEIHTHMFYIYIYIYISIDSSYICIWRAHNYRINHSRQSFFRSTDEYLNYFRVHLCVLMRNMVRKYKKFTNRKKHLRGHLPRHPLYDNMREKSQTNYKSTQNKSNKTKKIIADE